MPAKSRRDADDTAYPPAEASGTSARGQRYDSPFASTRKRADDRSDALRSLLPQRKPLQRLIRRLVRISSDADDIVQEAYLKLLEKPAAERESKAAPGYLFVIARNLAADNNRRSAREARRAAALSVVSTQLNNTEPCVEELVFVEQAIDCLRLSLRELPERTRQVFLLHRIEGLPHEEIASRMGITTRTVERNVATALTHLKRRLFSSEET